MSLNSITPKLDSFVQFCSEQPGDRVINHDTYDTCAMGDWAQSLGEFRHDAHHVLYSMLGEISPISPGLKEQLWDRIGNASNYPELETYSGMTEYLTKFKHDLLAAAQ